MPGTGSTLPLGAGSHSRSSYVMSGGLASPQGWNRYSHVGNDPVNYYDPEGLQRIASHCHWLKDNIGPEDASSYLRRSYWSYLVCEDVGGGDTASDGGRKALRKAKFMPIDDDLENTLQNDLVNLPWWLMAGRLMDDDCNKT